MRLFIDPSGYGTHNHGDTAMLLVALDRLSSRLPGAGFAVVNWDEDYLHGRYPKVDCVHPADRRAFFSGFLPQRRFRRIWPGIVSREPCIAVQSPGLWSSMLVLRRRLVGRPAGDAKRYAVELMRSQFLVVTGAGMLNDAFRDHALTVFDEMEIAVRNGMPVYLFGQGIGPIEDVVLREKARRMLPRAARICLREARSAAFLRQLGVPEERISVTGDDAVELAFVKRPPEIGTGLGFNLRIAKYSNLNPEIAAGLGQAIGASARELGAQLHPIPISRRAGEDDLDWGCRLVTGGPPLPEAGSRFLTPEDIIAEAGKCRTVVTASYHGAVFSLSQGVSVVALSRSPYYDHKFLGLAEQFGPTGCEVVRVGDDFSPVFLRDRIKCVWEHADQVRPRLLRAAEEQVRLGQAAYRRMTDEVSSRR